MKSVHYCVIVLLAHGYYAWRAIPAQQALYGRQSKYRRNETTTTSFPDHLLPRTSLHSIYKFGWCTRDSISHQFRYKVTNLSLSDVDTVFTRFIYLIDDNPTVWYKLQCVIVKVYVPKYFQFMRTRIPFYYCQGHYFYLAMMTIERKAIHEFYFAEDFKLPATFSFEFYHPIMI